MKPTISAKNSRREFLGRLGLLALPQQRRLEPDLILWNGNFITIDDANPRAEAVAIAGTRFLAAARDHRLQPGDPCAAVHDEYSLPVAHLVDQSAQAVLRFGDACGFHQATIA